jgi:hypothetical protein
MVTVKSFTTCPNCGVRIRADRIRRHIAKLHAVNANRRDLPDPAADGLLVDRTRVLFVRFQWPDWGDSSSFEPGTHMGIVLQKTRTHILVGFPCHDRPLEYIWFERPVNHSKDFWDTIYNVDVRQLSSTTEERLKTWAQVKEVWSRVRLQSQRLKPPPSSKVDRELLSRFAATPPSIRKRKPPKQSHRTSKPRLFVPGGLPGLGKR